MGARASSKGRAASRSGTAAALSASTPRPNMPLRPIIRVRVLRALVRSALEVRDLADDVVHAGAQPEHHAHDQADRCPSEPLVELVSEVGEQAQGGAEREPET